jgi:intron-binding protein aquarius
LQRAALKHFKEKLTILALSNYASIDKRTELEGHLESLTDAELAELCDLLYLRTSFPSSTKMVIDRQFLMEILLSTHEKHKTFQETARDLSILPTERTLFEPMLLRNDNYNGSQPLALPKLNLQYLTVGDFLWRSFILHRCESFYEIRKEMEDTIKRLRPNMSPNGQTNFGGFSKMALPITKPAILEVLPPLVGDDKPAVVRAEIALDVSRLADNIRREWESLRPDDVVFLLAVEAPAESNMVTNGGSTPSDAQRVGLRYLRAAEITQVLDDHGRSLREYNGNGQSNGHGRPRTRRLQIKLDATMFKEDMARVNAEKSNIYDSINVIVRRRGRENNFKPILESIRSLTLSDIPLAPWLHEVFLGYGDPAGATYNHLPNQLKQVDYRDTFLDWQHLIESFPGKTVEPSDDVNGSFGPPYVLQTMSKPAENVPAKPSKKRRRDAEPTPQVEPEAVQVSTYKAPNTGPYPTDAPKLNNVRFTPRQVEAIVSGTQPGLTVIVGPPGTGKTDVATQIINNIYHNFPEQRTLLIAHSNQALNQLFQKIVALDIDERHLLRLGHGEEELDTEANFSKHGRVESFLENRDSYLLEVDRLAANFGAPGAHGASAETAGYFNSVYVEPAWTRFQETAKDPEATIETILEAFPFHDYFSNAPQPLFPPSAEKDAILDIANGCYHHISKIFTELADVIPFEILRRDRDKANYLLTNEGMYLSNSKPLYPPLPRAKSSNAV